MSHNIILFCLLKPLTYCKIAVLGEVLGYAGVPLGGASGVDAGAERVDGDGLFDLHGVSPFARLLGIRIPNGTHQEYVCVE
jgi:hypothetical protein